jgi:hypothetical protein
MTAVPRPLQIRLVQQPHAASDASSPPTSCHRHGGAAAGNTLLHSAAQEQGASQGWGPVLYAPALCFGACRCTSPFASRSSNSVTSSGSPIAELLKPARAAAAAAWCLSYSADSSVMPATCRVGVS